MKFTILSDFEANKKRRAVRRQKRAERRDARQSRKNHWYLKRKKFWQVWLVCPCVSDSWNGWCMVF